MLTQEHLKYLLHHDDTTGGIKNMHREMLSFWKTMRNIYGHAWTGRYGETPTYGWMLAIGSLPADKIRSGMERLTGIGVVRSHPDNRFISCPPTPYEFRALCEPSDYGLDHLPISLSLH